MMHIPPNFHKIYKFPYLPKIYTYPPISTKFTLFLINLGFLLPRFDHDAIMHHTLHVLDAHEKHVWPMYYKILALICSHFLNQ